MNTLIVSGVHNENFTTFNYLCDDEKKREEKTDLKSINNNFNNSKTDPIENEKEEKNNLSNINEKAINNNNLLKTDQLSSITPTPNSFSQPTSSQNNIPSTQATLFSPPTISLHTRILKNDFGVPPSDFYRPSTHHHSPQTSHQQFTHQQLSLSNADNNSCSFYGDRGVDPAMKPRKGGRMQGRGRGERWKDSNCSCTKRRTHPHYFLPHQHCNDNNTSTNNNIYYDKLPTYCTLLSRPPLGIIRNVRIHPSELELEDEGKKEETLVFDKIPAYQSCFSNSTKYDKGSDYGLRSCDADDDDDDDDDETEVGDDDDDYHGVKRQRIDDVSDQAVDKQRQCNCLDQSTNQSTTQSSNHSTNHPTNQSTNQSSPRSCDYGSRFRVRSRGCQRGAFVDSNNGNNIPAYNNGNTCNNCGGYISSSNNTSSISNNIGNNFNTSNNRRLNKQASNRNLWNIPKAMADENSKQRRTLHVGKIPNTLSSKHLRSIFARFGVVSQCSVHFRELGDNYGFVTFARSEDALVAVENARSMEECRGWDVCFGGRRRFCQADYMDLDGSHQVLEEYVVGGSSGLSFNELLQRRIKNKD